MRAVYTISDNITSPLGTTTQENFSNLKNDLTGIRKHDNPELSDTAFHASLFPPDKATIPEALLFAVDETREWSLFERILVHSIKDAISKSSVDPANERVIFIISSTKGNISRIETDAAASPENISLYHSAGEVAGYFKNPNQPLVVSNACISGVLAILTAKRLIESGLYDTAIVAGADLITKFILSGFQSFQAVSPEPCKPFDAGRQGVTLGEGAATMVISADKNLSVESPKTLESPHQAADYHARPAANPAIRVMGGATSNDANHISGPSRNGEPLFNAISRSLAEAGLKATDIGFISAHGTATIYNDEMEAKAIALAGMESVPVNSLKGYYGHTLGAAGLIESIISVTALKENILVPTKGYEVPGVSKDINVCATLADSEYNYLLKTASGFGGCNAAMIFGKES